MPNMHDRAAKLLDNELRGLVSESALVELKTKLAYELAEVFEEGKEEGAALVRDREVA